jgi:hypothetical protein
MQNGSLLIFQGGSLSPFLELRKRQGSHTKWKFTDISGRFPVSIFRVKENPRKKLAPSIT